MPRLDRNGPMGAGPMTGGRRGLCGRTVRAADPPVCGGDYGYGRKMGFRRGRGGGRGRGFGPAYGAGYPVSKTDEVEMLRADAEAMQETLAAVRRRIAELDKEESK